VERVLRRNRLLNVLLVTLYFLAASDIFSDSEDLRNAIALSIEAMVVKTSRVEARCCRASKVCTSQGCARAREDVYAHRHGNTPGSRSGLSSALQAQILKGDALLHAILEFG
jgi:hypothetical protein